MGEKKVMVKMLNIRFAHTLTGVMVVQYSGCERGKNENRK